MVNKLSLEKVGVKGEKREGVAYIVDYSKKMSEKTGKTHIAGLLKDKSETMSFKVWQEKIPEFEAAIENSRIVNFSGILDDFGGTISITLSNADAYEGPWGITDFLEGIDETKLECEFWEIITNNCEAEDIEALKILFEIPIVKERFFKEFAGKSMHDALPGGLANHTIKAMKLYCCISDIYPIWNEYKSIMLLILAIHDLGKVCELRDGTYEAGSAFTHIDHLVEMLYDNKDKIIASIGKEKFRKILMGAKQHMHIYETIANTVLGMMAHRVDEMEAWLTKTGDAITNGYTELSNGDKVIGKGPDTLYI